MKAAIVTSIKLPGYLNITYNRFYFFQFQGKKVAIGLNKLTKGIKILDNENHHVDRDNKIILHKPIVELTKGHILLVGAVDNTTGKVAQQDSLQFSVEPDSVNNRDIFYSKVFIQNF